MQHEYENECSPVTTGLSLHTEDTTSDVVGILRQISPDEEYTLKPVTLSEVEPALTICETILTKNEVYHDEVVPLHIALQKRGRKLELTSGKVTAQTIRHTYGLFSIAKLLINEGKPVMILESCTGGGEQVISDVDMCYAVGSELHYVDYTQRSSNGDKKVYHWSRKDQAAKYRKLKLTGADEGHCHVLTYNMELKYFNLTDVKIKVYHSCPREDDFVLPDKITKLVHNLSWTLAESLLNSYSDQYKHFDTDRSSMVQTPGCYTSPESYQKVFKLINQNSETVASEFEQFQRDLGNCLELTRNKNHNAHNFFSLKTFEKLTKQSQGVRWVQSLPEIPRGLTTEDPFARISQIVTARIKEHKRVDAWTRMIAKLNEVDTVSFDDLNLPVVTRVDALMSRVTLHRAYAKGEKMAAYVMKVRSLPGHSSSIINTIIEPMRQYNESKRMEASSTMYSRLEREFKVYSDSMMGQGSSSYIIDDLCDMIDDVIEDGPLADTTRRIMMGSIEKIKYSKILSQIATTQEITMSLLTGARKRKRYGKNVGGIKESCCVFGLTNISDRMAVVSHNLGPLTFGEFKDVTYIVHGELRSLGNCNFCKSHYETITSPLSMSPAMMDWNITLTQKAISWASLYCENHIVNFPSKYESITKELVMPLSMMFLNSNTFSQVADQLRYFFVNGMGYTAGVGPLFEKIAWYTPKTTIELLYVLRMLKMSDCLAVAKTLNKTQDLVITSPVKIHEQHDLKMTVKVSGYDVAMPDESQSYLSQQHTFNSFYNSRALSIQRYVKLMSEALVMAKQMDAREEYLKIKSQSFGHEARFLTNVKMEDEEDLMQFIEDHDYLTSNAQPFSPCPRVAILGFLATTRLLRDPLDAKVGDTIRRAYQANQVHRNLKVSSVMNNRGSVRATETNGVSVTRVVQEKDKVTKLTQNSKCYKTIIDLLNRYVKGKTPAKAVPYEDIKTDEKAFDDDLSMLENLVMMPDNLAPVLAWLCNNYAACVSKMVHKDQLGAREIAVLNAASRIMCKYVEDVARHIRDIGLTYGIKSNLIEIADKRDIVLSEKRKHDVYKRTQNVMYDSADCSTWGPCMMCHDFYLILKLRFPSDCDTTMLRNSLSLFENKVFKIPDALYLDTIKNPNTEAMDMISGVKQRMLHMTNEMGSFDKQILYLEESMHQGILGCTSSVKGGDAHNLSNYVLMRLYKNENLGLTTYSTSDDYARIIRWDRGSKGTFSMLKDTLSIHVHILRTAGIKRNLQKSTVSSNYFEFNSEFFTNMGEIKPDIKSRLAYIDIATDTDPYPISLRAMNQAVEFLRSEGSILGSCWVYLLNNQLAMYSNQTRRLWKELGRGIYKVPLELGGLTYPDVIKSAISHPLLNLVENYGSCNNIEKSFSIMSDFSPFSTKISEIEETGEIKIKAPSLSRSGTIHLCKSMRRTTRDFEDFLMSADPSIFSGLHKSRYSSNLVFSLMASAQRERATVQDQGSALRFMVTQTPNDANIFRVNSPLLLSLTQDKRMLSREDLYDLAHKFSTIKEPDYPLKDWPLDFQQMYSDLKVYQDTITHMQPVSMSPVPRIGHTHVRRQTFSNQTFVYDTMREFESQNLPKIMGGSSDVHPWKYLESKMAFANMLSKLTTRKQGFRMVLREKDATTRNFVELLLVSNYVAGTRLHYNFNATYRPQIPLDSTLTSLLPILQDKLSPKSSGLTVSLLSPGLHQLCKEGRVSRFDVTDFVNVLTRESPYFIRSQELQQTVLSLLSSCGFSDRLVVNPLRLATGISENKYKSSQNVNAWQRNVSAEHGLSGREIIIQEGKTYSHYLWGTKHDIVSPEDTMHDHYVLHNVHDDNWIPALLVPRMGYMMLVEKYTRDPIQILSQSVIDSHPINMYLTRDLVWNTWLLRHLRLKLDTQFISSRIIDFYNVTTGHALDVEESEPSIEEKEKQFDVDLEAEDDDFLDFDLEDLLVDDETLSQLNKMQEVGIAESSSSSSAGEPSAPMSSQSSIRQPVGVLITLLESSMSEIPTSMVRRASRACRRDFVRGITVTLPVNLGITRLVDDENSSAIEKLYEIIDQMDDLDKEWLTDTLDHCFLSDTKLASEVRRFDVECKQEEEDDSGDW